MPGLHLPERVQRALPLERVLGAYGAVAGPQGGGNTALPPKEHRAVIFEGRRMAGDTWGTFWATLGSILTGDILENPSPSLARRRDRETARKQNYPYYGEWTSTAGRLLAAVQPRSKAGVYPVLTVTEHNLHVVCIQRRRGTFARLGEAMHVTGTIHRGDLSWVRDRGDPSFEFGFRDGSWATLGLISNDIRMLFTEVLAKKSPIPW